MNPSQAATEYPDFTAHYCDGFTCRLTAKLSSGHFSSLRRLCGKASRGTSFCDVEYKGRDAWIHLYATLSPYQKGSADIFLSMHQFQPEKGYKVSIVGHYDRFLRKMGQISREYDVSIGASFNYPLSKFESVITFPFQTGSAPPTESPLQVVGLRFATSTPPLQSVIVDTTGGDTILVSPSLRIRMPVNEHFPGDVLQKTRTVAERFVRPK